MGLSRILLSADGFMQDTPVSSWVYAGYSCQQLGFCRILLSAVVGFMHDTPVSSWVSAGYSCQQFLVLCMILLSAVGFMQETPVITWVYAGYSCQQLGFCRILLWVSLLSPILHNPCYPSCL
jgi:hypothetical protein